MPTKVIAHRGASRAEPENTIPAFHRAQAMGADWVELDVRRTADGAMAVHHDAHLPGAEQRAIVDTAAVDLPESVPSLAAALDACAGMGVNIEIKNDHAEPDFDASCGLADRVVALLADRGGVDTVLVSSFHLATIDRVREVSAGAVPTAWLMEVDEAGLDQALATLAHHGHHVLHPWVRHLTRAMVDRCHAEGVTVNTWTCDEPVRLAELIAWGVDGICTNVPDMLSAQLHEH